MSTLLQSSDLSASYPSAYRTKILDDVTKSRLDGDPLSESWSLTSSIIKAQSLASNSTYSHNTKHMMPEDSIKISESTSVSPSSVAQLTPPVSGDLHSLAWLQKNCILNIAPLDEEEAASGLVQANEIEVTTAEENSPYRNSQNGNISQDSTQNMNSAGNSLMTSTDSGFHCSYSASVAGKKTTTFNLDDDFSLSSNLNASFSSSNGAKSLAQYSSSLKHSSFSDGYHSNKTITPPPGSTSLNSSMSSLQFEDNAVQKPLCHPLIYNNGLPNQQMSSLSASNAGLIHLNSSSSSSLNSTAMATSGRRPPKPAYSYTHLIFMAIESTFHKCMTVNEIYNWCEANFPYFKSAGAGWKNSLRHNLSINKCFKRIPRDGRGPGRGAYWTVEPKERTQLLEAVKRNPWTLNTNQNAAFSFPGHYQYRSCPTVLSTNLQRIPYHMLDSHHQQHQAYSWFTGYSPLSPTAGVDAPPSTGLVVRNTDTDSNSNDNDATVVEEQQYAMLLKSLEDQAVHSHDDEATSSSKREEADKSTSSKGHNSDADNTRFSNKDEMPLVHKTMRKMLLNKRKCPSDEEYDSQMTERDMQGVMDLFNLQNRSSNLGDRSRNQEFCDECKENQQAGCEACLARSNSSSLNAPSKRTCFVTPAPMVDHEYARFQSVLRPRFSSLEDGNYSRIDDSAMLTSPEYNSGTHQIGNYSSLYSKDKHLPDRKRRKYNKRKKTETNHAKTYLSSDEQEEKDEPLKKVPRKRGRPSNKELAANQLKKKNVTKSDILEYKRLKKSKLITESHKNKVSNGYSSHRYEKSRMHVSSKFLKYKHKTDVNYYDRKIRKTIDYSTTASNSGFTDVKEDIAVAYDRKVKDGDYSTSSNLESTDIKDEPMNHETFDNLSSKSNDLPKPNRIGYDRDTSNANTAAQILLEISRLKLKRFQKQSGYWTSDSSPDQSPSHN